MRRLALTLATAVLASGCIIGDDDDDHLPPGAPGSAIVYWEFLRTAPAQGGTGVVLYDDATLPQAGTGACQQSGVEFVTIDTAGLPQFVVDCVYEGVQGATLDGLPPGPQSARIRGWRTIAAPGSAPVDVVVHDSSATLQVLAGQVTDQGILAVEPVREAIDVFGDLAFGQPPSLYATCAEGDNPNISYELFDGYGTRIEEGVVGCKDPLPTPVFVGDLDLDNYTVRMRGTATQGPSSGEEVFDSCAVVFDHFAPAVGEAGVPVTLFTLPVPMCQ